MSYCKLIVKSYFSFQLWHQCGTLEGCRLLIQSRSVQSLPYKVTCSLKKCTAAYFYNWKHNICVHLFCTLCWPVGILITVDVEEDWCYRTNIFIWCVRIVKYGKINWLQKAGSAFLSSVCLNSDLEKRKFLLQYINNHNNSELLKLLSE